MEAALDKIVNVVINGWRTVGNLYFETRDAFSMDAILRESRYIRYVVAFSTPAGLGFFVRTFQNRVFCILSLRDLSMVVISGVGVTMSTRSVWVLQRNEEGVQGTTHTYHAISKLVVASCWSKVNRFDLMPIASGLVDARQSVFSFKEIEQLYTQQMYENLNLRWTYAPEEKIKIILVNSGENAYKTINGFLSGGLHRALLFTLMINTVKNADTPYVMSTPFQKKEPMNDLLADFETYIKRPDPAICEKYSFDGYAYPAPSWMTALDRLPWDKLSVTREDAIACVQLQNRLFSEQDVVKMSNMVERIAEEIARGDFTPQLYKLTRDDTEPIGRTVVGPQTSVRHDGLNPFNQHFAGWSLFAQGEKIGAFIYTNGGGLYQLMKENEVIILSLIAVYTVNSVMLHTRGLGADTSALAVVGAGINTITPYLYRMHTIAPMTKEGIGSMVRTAYTVLPSKAWLWTAGSSVSTVVVTTTTEYPRAVFAAGVAWYFKDDIKNISAGLIGLVVMAIGGVALMESGIVEKAMRKSIKRKKRT
jgi:hypothetical protein